MDLLRSYTVRSSYALAKPTDMLTCEEDSLRFLNTLLVYLEPISNWNVQALLSFLSFMFWLEINTLFSKPVHTISMNYSATTSTTATLQNSVQIYKFCDKLAIYKAHYCTETRNQL